MEQLENQVRRTKVMSTMKNHRAAPQRHIPVEKDVDQSGPLVGLLVVS